MRFKRLLPALVVATLVGCGQTQVPLTPRAPHGGMIFDLPDKQGMVELVRQEIADQPGRDRILIYFLDTNQKPMSSAPKTATLKLRGRNAGSLEFTPPSGADASQIGMLECLKLPNQEDAEGVLTTTVDGKPVSLSVNVR